MHSIPAWSVLFSLPLRQAQAKVRKALKEVTAPEENADNCEEQKAHPKKRGRGKGQGRGKGRGRVKKTNSSGNELQPADISTACMDTPQTNTRPALKRSCATACFAADMQGPKKQAVVEEHQPASQSAAPASSRKRKAVQPPGQEANPKAGTKTKRTRSKVSRVDQQAVEELRPLTEPKEAIWS